MEMQWQKTMANDNDNENNNGMNKSQTQQWNNIEKALELLQQPR